MRPIKFRAWDIKAKVMLDPESIFAVSSKGEIMFKILDEPKFMKIDGQKNYFLMQFTGLKDKNGKEIYEGDIVVESSTKIRSKPEVVEYITDEWCEDGFYTGYLFWSGSSNYEVIGNLYENPELLSPAQGGKEREWKP